MWMQIQNFYNGLTNVYKIQLESVANGDPEELDPEALYELIERLVNTSYKWHSVREDGRNESNSPVAEEVSRLTAQVEQLSKQIVKLNKPTNQVHVVQCDFCEGNHHYVDCTGNQLPNQQVEHCDYAGNNQRSRSYPYSNHYNDGWRNHPNLSWTPPAQPESSSTISETSKQLPAEQPGRRRQEVQGGGDVISDDAADAAATEHNQKP
ncbi:hypothetical protein M5689_024894 [Euphorbia peplus]|nr:hypothetical protein M5689_024894 [Euphorbia peplus]